MTRSPVPDATLVQARIHPRALRHMSRYFDSTVISIFVELIQNARRAGATRVDIVADSADTGARHDTPIVTVQDNGRGIADPAVLLSFGESDWDGDLARTERARRHGHRPAWARRFCTVYSRPRTPSSQPVSGWRMALDPYHFLGNSAANRRARPGGAHALRDLRDVPRHRIAGLAARGRRLRRPLRAAVRVVQRPGTGAP